MDPLLLLFVLVLGSWHALWIAIKGEKSEIKGAAVCLSFSSGPPPPAKKQTSIPVHGALGTSSFILTMPA
ncbi:hypothetical protein LX36DRAFT_654616 [Colletotrichum falcatum]|nr:hypothetical protein LX36DRAFT_654616 [Colletotrichum falcatum]